MPLYEYECKKCGHRFEKIVTKFSDPPETACPKCGGAVEQLLSAPAVQFKGSGWYVTDYAKKGSASGSSSTSKSEPGKSDSSDSAAKPDTSAPKSDTKPDAKK